MERRSDSAMRIQQRVLNCYVRQKTIYIGREMRTTLEFDFDDIF